MITRQLKEWYRRANRFSGGRLVMIDRTLETFAETRAPQAAASLAYYAFFSLFPLLLVFIAGGSYFLNRQQVYQEIARFVQDVIPVSPDLINQNLRQVLAARGTVGALGLLTLLWSASGAFTNLAYSLNLAWPEAPRRNFLEKRLVGLGMIAALSALLALSMGLGWVSELVPIYNQGGWRLLSKLGSWLMIFLLFLALYRWVPTAQVSWRAITWGAMAASLGWSAAASGFSWYLRSGFGRYQLVYGSLGAIVALLFLIYLVSLITLFGAHLSAAVDRWKGAGTS